MKSKAFKLNLGDKKENIKLLFLVQVLVILAAMTYLSTTQMGIIDEDYHNISGDKVFMTLLILSGFVGIASFYLFHEIVKLIEKEKEYDIQHFELIQMQETNDLLRSQKHDFSNNLQVVWGLLSIGDSEKAKGYISKYSDTLKLKEDEIAELSNISCTYLYTLFLNKSHKCNDMGVELSYAIEPDISLEDINPIDLVRVFGNLLDNAIYAVQGLDEENRYIAVDMYKEEDNYIFEVANKGPEIPLNMRNKIFEKGFTTKGDNGSGMGLYNVKQIISKYNAIISVENSEEIKTIFRIKQPKNFKNNIKMLDIICY